MTNRKINSMLWGAFMLGAGVVADRAGQELSGSDVDTLADVVRQIAESDATLQDPTALAAKEQELGQLLMRVGTFLIRRDGDLAKRIYEGFLIATGEKE
jgi:hypothetical protein